jgi:hypothetical protein
MNRAKEFYSQGHSSSLIGHILPSRFVMRVYVVTATHFAEARRATVASAYARKNAPPAIA